MQKLSTVPVVSVVWGRGLNGAPVSDIVVSVAGVAVASKTLAGRWTQQQAEGEWKRNRKSFNPVKGFEKWLTAFAA